MSLSPKLDLIILDCPDAAGLADFYSRLLGWPIQNGSGDHFVTLVPPGGGVAPDNADGRPTLAFQRVEDFAAPTWPSGGHPQQLHLDFCVDDIDAAEPEYLRWEPACTATSRPRTVGSGFSWTRPGTPSA